MKNKSFKEQESMSPLSRLFRKVMGLQRILKYPQVKLYLIKIIIMIGMIGPDTIEKLLDLKMTNFLMKKRDPKDNRTMIINRKVLFDNIS
jgi:hypothetical protein